MSSRWIEGMVNLTMVAGVLSTFGVICYRLASSPGADLSTILPPANWDLGFLANAFFAMIIAESDIPQIIRKSAWLRRQAQVLGYSALFLGVAYALAAGRLVTVPNLVIAVAAVASGLLSLAIFIRHCLGG